VFRYIDNKGRAAVKGAEIMFYLQWLATGWTVEESCSTSGRDGRFFSSPQRQDNLWGPPILLFNAYRGGSFPMGKAAGK
jgi:hypothetical protein